MEIDNGLFDTKLFRVVKWESYLDLVTERKRFITDKLMTRSRLFEKMGFRNKRIFIMLYKQFTVIGDISTTNTNNYVTSNV